MLIIRLLYCRFFSLSCFFIIFSPVTWTLFVLVILTSKYPFWPYSRTPVVLIPGLASSSTRPSTTKWTTGVLFLDRNKQFSTSLLQNRRILLWRIMMKPPRIELLHTRAILWKVHVDYCHIAAEWHLRIPLCSKQNHSPLTVEHQTNKRHVFFS